jgi:adenine-specific DNA-methyltransferase
MNSLEKLQELLRDLFQLDLADLDFGMYRLLHLKRQELEAFLYDQLPRRVREAFQSMAGQESIDLEKNLSELQGKLRDNLGEAEVLAL